MSGRRKPRAPRRASNNPLAIAKAYAALLPKAEVDQELASIREAFRALREGVAIEWEWMVVVSTANISAAIEHQGVVAGLHLHIKLMQDALQAIGSRAMETGEWRPTALYFQEIDAIREGIHNFDFQVRQLSAGEYCSAQAYAIAEVRSTGGQVIESHSASQQLALIGG